MFFFSETVPVTKGVKKQRVEGYTLPKMQRCRQLPEYHQRPNITLEPKTVDGVETLLMFIGYPRSGHTLIGSLLDAHPNMVVANEYHILEKWKAYARKDKNKQHLFQELYTNSYREAHNGDRSLADCAPTTKYKYTVPNQWQGKFDGKMKVGVLFGPLKLFSNFLKIYSSDQILFKVNLIFCPIGIDFLVIIAL